MSLTSGKSTLASALASAWLDGAALKNAPVWARLVSTYVYDFVQTGVPMTIVTTLPGSVLGGATSGPVKGSGIGGFDKPVPGIGLEAALPTLKQDLISAWTHGNAVKDAQGVANGVAQAIYSYFSQAMIQTKDETSGPVPALPPSGPVSGSIQGKGGLIAASPGIGYDAAKPILEAELTRIWSQTADLRTVEQLASEVAEAIHTFCIEGIVETQGTFVAPAAVPPPPAPPNGAYFAGIGAATGTVS